MAVIIKPSQPVLVDKVIEYMQFKLHTSFSWLDYSFGRVQRLVKKDINGNDIYYPGILLDNSEYQSCLPDQDKGNISFFIIDDPQQIDWNKNQLKTFTVPFSVVFWFNIDKAYGYGTNTENVKGDIIKNLSKIHIPYQGSGFEITKIYEKAENIYKGYSLKEVNSQYLMFPFSGLRFEGEIKFMEPCTR